MLKTLCFHLLTSSVKLTCRTASKECEYLRMEIYRILFNLDVCLTVHHWHKLYKHQLDATIAGSIPDGVIGIFHVPNPSDRTMALGSTQPLTEMSTRRISYGLMLPVFKADNLTNSLCLCHEIWNLNFLETSGPLHACNGTDIPLDATIMVY